MSRRRMEYPVWLLSAACLYFFENNTGTRIVLAASLAAPLLVRFLRTPGKRRRAFRGAGEKTPPEKDGAPSGKEAEGDGKKAAACAENEPDVTVREYRPGDPVRRIHWKLSAKTDRLLIRESMPEKEEAPVRAPESAGTDDTAEGTTPRETDRLAPAARRILTACAAVLPVLLILCVLIPETRNGLKSLCNSLFDRSEAVNAYVYERFDVPEGGGAAAASAMLAAAGAAWTGILVLSRRHAPVLLTAVLLTGFQVYFGVSFPPAANGLLYAGLGLLLMPRPLTRKTCLLFCAAAAAAAMLVYGFAPGVDEAVENASERARDQLSRAVQQTAGASPETPAETVETRHMNARSVLTGGEEAGKGKSYRLVTEEEEQISRPDRPDFLRTALLLLLTAAVTVLPFLPFAVLSARRKKGRESRKIFESGDYGEAVRAMFQHVIYWMRLTRHDAGNLLYRDWTREMSRQFSEEYADRYARCAALFEEAAYSDHPMSAEDRDQVRALLEETERMLYARADRRQRFRLRYVECVYDD